MTKFACARWRAQIEGEPIEAAPVFVFQTGRVYRDGERVGTFCQTKTHFIADLDAGTTMLVPLDQPGRERYSAVFRFATDGEAERRPGALIREEVPQL